MGARGFREVDMAVAVAETKAGARVILLTTPGSSVLVTPSQARELAAALVELADSVPSA